MAHITDDATRIVFFLWERLETSQRASKTIPLAPNIIIIIYVFLFSPSSLLYLNERGRVSWHFGPIFSRLWVSGVNDSTTRGRRDSALCCLCSMCASSLINHPPFEESRKTKRWRGMHRIQHTFYSKLGESSFFISCCWVCIYIASFILFVVTLRCPLTRSDNKTGGITRDEVISKWW